MVDPTVDRRACGGGRGKGRFPPDCNESVRIRRGDAGPPLRAAGLWRILRPMEWTTPTWAEIKMDAEIGSYQEDYEPTRDPIAETDGEEVAAA